MSAIRFLAADKLASWLAEVAASRQVLAPRQEASRRRRNAVAGPRHRIPQGRRFPRL